MTITWNDERERLSSTNYRVLEALQQAGPDGLTNVEICRPEIGGLRGGARLGELRRAGYPVNKVHIGGGKWRYWLDEQVPEGRLF